MSQQKLFTDHRGKQEEGMKPKQTVGKREKRLIGQNKRDRSGDASGSAVLGRSAACGHDVGRLGLLLRMGVFGRGC